jgi:hypothetical protein
MFDSPAHGKVEWRLMRPKGRREWVVLRGVCAHLLLWAALSLTGCGAGRHAVRDAELTGEEARLFEHGADFIGRLSGLEGKWRSDWDRDLAERVKAADLIAIVNLRRSRTDRDPEMRITHRFYGDVERAIQGSAPAQSLELVVNQGDAGFPSVDGNLTRLQGARVLVYVRWYRSETGAIENHFHLSPASDEVIAAAASRVAPP